MSLPRQDVDPRQSIINKYVSPHRDGGGVGVGGGCNELDESVHLKDMQSDNIIRGTHDRLQKKKLIFEEIENKSQMQKEMNEKERH